MSCDRSISRNVLWKCSTLLSLLLVLVAIFTGPFITIAAPPVSHPSQLSRVPSTPSQPQTQINQLQNSSTRSRRNQEDQAHDDAVSGTDSTTDDDDDVGQALTKDELLLNSLYLFFEDSFFDEYYYSNNYDDADGIIAAGVANLLYTEYCQINKSIQCYVNTKYNDLENFEFSFLGATDSGIPPIEKPIIESSDMKKLQAIIVDYESPNEENFYLGFFQIAYTCLKPGNTTVTMKWTVLKKEFNLLFIKECAMGTYTPIQYGYFKEDENDTPVYLVSSASPDESKSSSQLVVPPNAMSTTFFFEIIFPAYLKSFAQPVVKSDNPDVSVTVRGEIATEYFNDFEPTEFHASYSCAKKEGGANLTMNIGVDPFDPIIIKWRKNCGGGNLNHLSIIQDADGVVIADAGQVSKEFAVQLPFSTDQALHEYSVDDYSVTYDLKNNEEDSSQYITLGKPLFSIGKTSVLVAKVVPGKGNQYLAANGGDVEAGATMKLTVHFICKQKGRSVVMITLPVDKHNDLEWGFYKSCDEPIEIQESSLLTVHGIILCVVGCVAVSFGIVIYFYLRRRSQTRNYQPTPSEPLAMPRRHTRT